MERISLFGGLDSGLECGAGLWDWTVRESCAHHYFRVTETTQEVYSFRVCEFLVATQLSLQCEFVISGNLMLTGGLYGIGYC